MHEVLKEREENDNYGVERMRIALEKRGVKASKSTVRRVMGIGNLLHRCHRSPDGLTVADKKAMRPKNILARNFTASMPNEKWLTDITQVKCRDGVLYIAAVVDCFGREVVGLEMDDNMRATLCINAVKSAYQLRHPTGSVLIHSDAGSQYTSEDYRRSLGEMRAIQSMSDVGKCYDNAPMESFFATLKKEKVYRVNSSAMTMREVKRMVWRYIMTYYNNERICTVNGGLPPSVYRERFGNEIEKCAA